MLHKKGITAYRESHPKYIKTLWKNCRVLILKQMMHVVSTVAHCVMQPYNMKDLLHRTFCITDVSHVL